MPVKTTLWNRKGNENQRNELFAVLAVLIKRNGGSVIVAKNDLDDFDGSVGLRARYLPDGGLEVWTYDVVEDLKGLTANE